MASSKNTRYATLIVVAVDGVQVTTSIQDSDKPSPEGSNVSLRSETTLEEFLVREHDFAMPDGTPIVRFDTTDGEIWSAFFNQGPADHGSLTPGTVRRPGHPAQPYDGQRWDALTGFFVSDDVYALLAEQAGMVVERVTTRRS